MKVWQSERKLITAVTLAYNKLDFVQKTVQSVAHYKGISDNDLEYVLWDQGSPYEGVAEYLEKLRKFDYSWLQIQGGGFNVGVGAALNRVIESTDSEFIFKLDDDTELLPFTLPLLVIAYAAAVSAGYPMGVLSADVIGTGKAQGPYDEVELMPGIYLEGCPCVGGGAVLISRHVLGEVGPFREDRLYGVEDGDFAARALAKGFRNAYLKGAYHISKCRTTEADPEIDKWKHEYYFNRTDLDFAEWRGK